MIKDEYEKYEKSCYPTGLHPIQQKEVKQAFYSGAFVLGNLLIDLLEKPDSEIEKIFDDVYKEISLFLKPGPRN